MDRRNFLLSTGASLAAMPTSVRAFAAGRQVTAEELLAADWDYVIVGGGSAGCVLARRLSEDGDIRVLLLEAGEEASDPAIYAPPAWPGLAGGEYDWKYQSTVQEGLLNRSVPEPRGKGLGGSTLINALAFQRGPHQAYDQWAAQTGDAGWRFENFLPYFRRLETASNGANAYRGGDGPLHVLEVGHEADQNPLAQAVEKAGVSAGYPLNPDWNGARADGTIWSQMTIKDGRRDTASTAYLDPVRTRPNLGILTGAQAVRVLVEKNDCVGVEVETGGSLKIVRPVRELILSAGAFDTPRLLMLSGIGNAEDLRKLGIAPVHDLPGVGANLADHPLVPGLLFRSKQPLPASRFNHCETMVIASSRHSPGWADLQLMALSVPFLSPELGAPAPQTFSIVPALMYTRSRGSIRLASADPRVQPLIDPAYLADPLDTDALVDAFEISRHVARQRALREWIAEEVFPGPGMQRRRDLAQHIRKTASPFFHPVSTCRIGRPDDATAVLDTAFRVRGIGKLRVVDASAFPSIPQAMTNAPVLALAERAADIIRERTPAS